MDALLAGIAGFLVGCMAIVITIAIIVSLKGDD